MNNFKGILQMFLVTLIICIVGVVAFNVNIKQQNTKSDTQGKCPIKNIETDTTKCYECHREKTFELKSPILADKYDLPGVFSKIVRYNGEDCGLFNVYTVNGYVGTNFDQFMFYLNNNFPEIKYIIVDIFSEGGSVFDGHRVYGMIKYWQSRGYVIETRSTGFAMSAGVLIFCAGNPRYVSLNAELMYHNARIDKKLLEHYTKFEKNMLKHVQKSLNKIIADVSTLSVSDIEEGIKNDSEVWFTGKEAIELGIATGELK